jgi:hypothetical protein
MRLVLLLTLPLYILDQITKFLVLANIPTHVTIEVIPGFFNLVQVHNTGAAFGMLKDNNWFFIGLASVALIAVAVMAKRGCFPYTPRRRAPRERNPRQSHRPPAPRLCRGFPRCDPSLVWPLAGLQCRRLLHLRGRVFIPDLRIYWGKDREFSDSTRID